MVVVVATALIGGLAAAVVSALVSALLLNYLFTPPLYTLTIAEPENVVTIALFVAVGIAVATVVDTAARRTAQARAARAEADALTVLAHSLLTSSDDTDGPAVLGVPALQCRRAPRSYAATRRAWRTVVASCGTPPASVERADMAAAIDDRNTLVPGRRDAPRVRARPAQRLRRLRQGDGRAPRCATVAEVERLRLEEADRTRTALLAAVSHDLRNPLAAAKVAVASLRSTDVTFSQEDEAELLATIEESTDRLERAGRQPARHEPDQHRLRARRCSPRSTWRPRSAGASRRWPVASASRSPSTPTWWSWRTPACSTGCWPTSARTP